MDYAISCEKVLDELEAGDSRKIECGIAENRNEDVVDGDK
jgi:hypothetical protein